MFDIKRISFALCFVFIFSCEEDQQPDDVQNNVGQTQSDCVAEPGDVCGCTDSEAINYNPLATVDDETCQFYTGELSVVWSKDIEVAGEMWSMRPVSDGGFILACGGAGDCEGGTYQDPCEYYGQLVRLDAGGDVMWHKTYDKSSGIYHARETSDGGFIAAGYYECVNSMDCYPDMYIMKTDSEGNLEWYVLEASTANNNDWARDVIQTQDGNYVVTGTWNDDGWNSTVTLRKYDTGGDLMWFKNFNNSTANESYEIIETSEGDLVFAGYSGTQHGFYKWFIVKTDSDGNQIWSKAKNSVGDAILYGISESPNGGYVAAGFCNSWRSNLVTKRNPNNGNSTFTECIIGEVNVAGVYDITPAIGGGYYIIDERNNLTKIDEEGQVVLTESISNNLAVIELFNGDVVVGGRGAFLDGGYGGYPNITRLSFSGSDQIRAKEIVLQRTSVYLIVVLLFSLSCSNDNISIDDDCAGNAGGTSICGCTDSTAFNYNSNATHDDGSCEAHIDNGDFFLSFNGTNSSVDVGDVISQGAYTKAAWVKRNYGYQVVNNIVSGNVGHVFYAPQSQQGRLSAGHNGDWNMVQDPDSIPEAVWTYVAVTYDPDIASGTLTLFTNGILVDQATGVEPPEESSSTFIGSKKGNNVWYGSIDEVAIWNKALEADEISEIGNNPNSMNATSDHGKYTSSANLQGYWKMNEGEGNLLSDASGNGNIGTIEFALWKTCDECGCMDQTACNYDASATVDNRACEYVENSCDECIDSQIIDNDFDDDGICNDLDEDDDNDNVTDDADQDPLDNTICSDNDGDGCDDCSSGIFNVSNDGPDDDGDGICNGYIIPGRKVYIVGESYNSQGDYTACYWVDGERFELQGGAWATDIVVVDGTVYTSGTSESYNACYWIDQTRYDLPGSWGEAEAIAVDGDDVYVAGWFNNGSCYWKNGQKINLTVNRDSQAFAIGVHNNGDVYVGGYYTSNHHYWIPCFWKNGTSRTNLQSGEDGEVYDMVLMDGTTRYYAGNTTSLNNMLGYPPRACYWKNTRRNQLPKGGNFNSGLYGTGALGITTDGSDIYVAGYADYIEDIGDSLNTGGRFPRYWKNNSIHTLEGGPITAFGTGEAYDIRVADGSVVVVGLATRNPDYNHSFETACYWVDGEIRYLVSRYDVPEELGLEDWETSVARGVFIE